MNIILKISLIIFSINLNLDYAYVQTVTWQREYPLSYYAEGSTSTQIKDEGYMLSGQTNLQPSKFSVLKVDLKGDTIWSRLFNGDFCSQIYQVSDSNLLIIGGLKDQIVSYKVNLAGSILWSKNYKIDLSSIPVYVLELINKDLVIFGNAYSNGPGYSFALKTNNKGDSISIKYIHESNRSGKISFFRQNKLLLTGFKLTPKICVITDLEGNVIRNSTSLFSFGIADSNSGYFYFLRDTSISTYRSLIIEKVDTNFNIILTRIITIPINNLYSNDINISNSGIIICGTSNNSIYVNPVSFLLKVSYNLEVIWYKDYYLSNRFHYLQSVIQTSDLGYFASGSIGIDRNFKQGGESFLFGIKTDSLGNVNNVGIENLNFKISDFNFLYQNFPNPFNLQTIIKFDLNMNSYIRLKIYNSIGQILETVLERNLSQGSYKFNYFPSNSYSTGVYFYSLEIFNSFNKQTLTKKFVILK